MTIQLNWRTNAQVSVLHAAEALLRHRPLADANLAAAIAKPTAGLAVEINAQQLPASRFWQHLIALASGNDGIQHAIEVALTRTIGRNKVTPARVSELASWIIELNKAAQRVMPNLEEQLSLRVRPMREQWEARGPGMLLRIREITDGQILVDRAEVELVHPAIGGAGAAHLQYNSVRIEAVLTNVTSQLPEACRLAWLLSQLNLDLPGYSELIHGDRLAHVAELATLPVTLSAAQHVELGKCDFDSLRLACGQWLNDNADDSQTPDVVWQWWETYVATRPEWRVALSALDRMLEKPP